MNAVERDEYIGFCRKCGCEHDQCEPDTRRRTCERCGEQEVYGAEELLFMTID